MHVLVSQRERVEVAGLGGERAIEHRLEVAQHLWPLQQRQVPARVVRHPRRVVERVPLWQERRGRERAALGPVLLEPGQVAHLPEDGIDDGEARPQPLLVVEIADQREGAGAGVGERGPDAGSGLRWQGHASGA